MFSQRYEQGSTLVTSNLPFNEWTEVFGSERLTGALLDRLTHHVHILEMNGESFRLIQSKKKRSLFGLTHRPLARFSWDGLHYVGRPKGRPQAPFQPSHENRYPFTNWSTFAPPKWSKFTGACIIGCSPLWSVSPRIGKHCLRSRSCVNFRGTRGGLKKNPCA